MVNARMSARSSARWAYAPALIRALLGKIELLLAQTDGDANRPGALGARSVQVIGNLKYDAQALPADLKELAALSGLTSGRQPGSPPRRTRARKASPPKHIGAWLRSFPMRSR